MTSFVSPLEILHVTSKQVSCNGTKEDSSVDLGHPLVYLDMGKNNFVVCPYCSRYFSLEKKSVINFKKNLKKNG